MDGGLAASTQMYDAGNNTVTHKYGGSSNTPKRSASVKKTGSKIQKKK